MGNVREWNVCGNEADLGLCHQEWCGGDSAYCHVLRKLAHLPALHSPNLYPILQTVTQYVDIFSTDIYYYIYIYRLILY